MGFELFTSIPTLGCRRYHLQNLRRPRTDMVFIGGRSDVYTFLTLQISSDAARDIRLKMSTPINLAQSKVIAEAEW